MRWGLDNDRIVKNILSPTYMRISIDLTVRQEGFTNKRASGLRGTNMKMRGLTTCLRQTALLISVATYFRARNQIIHCIGIRGQARPFVTSESMQEVHMRCGSERG